MDFVDKLGHFIRLLTIPDLADMLIVAVVIYKLLKVIRHTNAERLAKGIILLLLAVQAASWMKLQTI